MYTLSKEEKENFEILGITKFWDAGYTGKNINIMSHEKIQKDYEKTDRWNNIICPAGYQGANGSSHGSSVMYILLQVCPDAQYYCYPLSCSGNAQNAKSACGDFIKEKNIHLFTTSKLGSFTSAAQEKIMQECIDAGCTFFAAAGNEGNNGLLGEAKSEKYLAIGGITKDGKEWKKVSYSSTGKDLDYVSIETYGVGTSYIAPIFCGMCGLVQDFFLKNAGRVLRRHELINFINDNLLDVNTQGFDIYTGYGLFILPDPKTIDIAKYCTEIQLPQTNNIPLEKENDDVQMENNIKIEMFIDKKYMYVNGQKIDLDTAPFIKNGRTFVPIRFISEYLGHQIEWNDKEQKVIIQ